MLSTTSATDEREKEPAVCDAGVRPRARDRYGFNIYRV